MDFEQRLKRAIDRGRKSLNEKSREAEQEQLSIEELKTLHSGYRLELSEHLETCLRQLADHLPGFDYQTILGEEGWGGRLTRDDIDLKPGGQASTKYSRLEMIITPFSPTAIVELVTKGTVRNREVLTRTNYQKVDDFDIDSFKELVDLRVLEFAEMYTSSN